MSWNYRILQVYDEVYEMIEVYYNADGSIGSWTENTVKPFGDSKEELAAVIEMMLAAQLLPVLAESLDGDELLELDY